MPENNKTMEATAARVVVVEQTEGSPTCTMVKTIQQGPTITRSNIKIWAHSSIKIHLVPLEYTCTKKTEGKIK